MTTGERHQPDAGEPATEPATERVTEPATGLATELRDFALELADLADELSLAAFRGALDVRTKADGTWVTQIDEAVEQRLRDEIARRYPDHGVLGEEAGRQGPLDGPTWIIDPIDGTTNFVRGNPIFATLIAVQVDGVEVAGVASAPALGTRWDAVSGGPARQDGRTIRVSDAAELAVAEITFGGLAYFHERGLGACVAQLSRTTSRQRGYGDFWGHCLVASGSSDIAIEAAVSLWDVAAIKVIVEAAGGRFTSLAGDATADGGDALSTNGLLHDDVLELIASAGAR